MSKTIERRGRRGGGTVRKHGKSWQARWLENGQREYHSGFASKDDAARFLRERTAKIQLGIATEPAPVPRPQKTFGQLVEDWLDNRKAEDRRTVADDRRRWSRHLAPVLGHRTPDSIDIGFLDDLITNLKNPPVGTKDPAGEPKAAISGATAQRVIHLLSAFYVWLEMHHGVTSNPVRGLSRHRKIRDKLRSTHNPKKVPFLKRKEDVAALFRALPEPVNVAYALSALAGLRPGEALALQWDDVDLDSNEIHIQRQVHHGVVGVPKSGKDRHVPVLPSLHAVLSAWQKKNKGQEMVVPALRYPGKKGRPRGRFLNGRTIRDALSDALKSCGLKSMTFYEAGRHTFASQWVLSGNSIYRLKEIMGHSSVQVTERYAHLTNQLTDAELARADVRLAS